MDLSDLSSGFGRLGVTALADAVRRRAVSARELTAAALDRIAAVDPGLRAFVAVDGERALADAAALDERIARGEDVGPLAGVPLGVKDLEDAAGFVTTHGSLCHADDPPAESDSVLVARLRAAGCVVVGKTNTPEHGWKGDTDNLLFGPTFNPWSPVHSAGGSSGGSGAAVAAGMVPLCTGSDGGGSIRIPSSVNGLSGFKPTTGRVPGGGPNPPAWLHLSTKGPMARRIRDVAAVLDVVVGPEPTDLNSLPAPADGPWAPQLDGTVPPGLRVGWSPTLGYAVVDDEVARVCAAAVEVLGSLGAEVVEVPSIVEHDPVGTFLVFANIGNLGQLERYREMGWWERIDPGLRAFMEWAERHVTALDYLRALDQCHHLNRRFAAVFADVDVLVTPALAAVPPVQGQFGVVNGEPDPNWVRFTYPFNLTKLPAGVVTAGFSETGLPIGLQVAGPQHGDLLTLRVLAALEDALGHVERLPLVEAPPSRGAGSPS